MHIENPDALKSWLTPVLEPLCDADPTALAKYVLALLKKDKPLTELSGCMAEQLDVFLGKETKQFLEQLFRVIQSQEYITVSSSENNSQEQQQQQQQNQPAAVSVRESTPPVSSSSNSLQSNSGGSRRTKESVDDDGGRFDRTTSTRKDVLAPSKSKSQEPISKNLSVDGNRDIRRRRISNRSKSRSRSRSRSRSKSNERIRRSRSRERRLANNNDYQRDKGNNRYRNPSHSLASRRKNGGASPEYRSFEEVNAFVNKSKRCRDFDEKGYCMRGETCPWDHGVDPVVLEDLNNPVGMPPVAMNINRAPLHSEYNPDAPDLWSRGGAGFPPARMMIPAPRQPYQQFGFRGGPAMPFGMPGANPLQRELISVPVMDPNGGAIPAEVPPPMKRRFENEEGMTANVQDGPKRKIPINARLGPRVNASGIPINPQQNCSLELRKIPRGLNAISHLNDHFSKFGKITNIQIAYEKDPEAAIVTFSTHAEANVAYRSTEAVLNNRFIKVFWHSGAGASDSSMSGPTGSLPKPSELSVRRFPYQQSNNTAGAGPQSQQQQQQANQSATPQDSSNAQPEATSGTDTPTTSTAPVTSKSTTFMSSATIAAQQAAQQQRLKAAKLNRATTEMIRKKQKEQQKEAVQLAQGIYQKKQELLQKNVTQIKQLLEKLEKTDPLDPARSQLMETIKLLQGTIDKLKQELKSDSAQIVATMQTAGPPQRKTKEQTQKELLDCELELISKEQHGDNDTYAIQKRYLELQKSLKGPHFAPAGPRPAVVRPTIARFGSTSVDHRPTTIHITGFALDESDAVLGHFKHFGEITKNILDEAEKVPFLILSYATRINAEQALARGRQFKEKTLTIKWYTETVVAEKEAVATEKVETESSDASKFDMDSKTDVEKKEGSDDEDVEEERSWRRGYDDGE